VSKHFLGYYGEIDLANMLSLAETHRQMSFTKEEISRNQRMERKLTAKRAKFIQNAANVTVGQITGIGVSAEFNE